MAGCIQIFRGRIKKMGGHQSGDTPTSVSESEHNGATSQQLGVSKQLLDKISGHLRRADESTAKVEWAADQLNIATANISNRVKELGGESRQTSIPTREQIQSTSLTTTTSPTIQPSQSQEEEDLER